MRRVLVVDDEPQIRAVLGGYLQAAGFAVIECGDGESTVRAVRDEQPDLVLLDVMLPGIDGLQVLRQLRVFSDVYVVLVTARTEVDTLVGLGWAQMTTSPSRLARVRWPLGSRRCCVATAAGGQRTAPSRRLG